MDPDTARLVAQIGADATRNGAVIGLLSALAATAVAQLGQLLLSNRTYRHQRNLAREQDWRNELARRVASIVAIADGRMGLYKRAVVESALIGAGAGDLESLMLSTVHGDADVFKTTAYLGVPDTQFHAAVQAFMARDIEARRKVRTLIESMSGRWGDAVAKADAQPRLAKLIEPLNQAIWNLHEAANTAVYSGALSIPSASKALKKPEWTGPPPPLSEL